MDEHFNPALDRPENRAYSEILSEESWRLANQDVYCHTDADCTLYNLVWPWADATYVRKIEFRISDPRDGELMPMWVRHYPAYHETIYGNEGMVICKQLFVPLKSHYDRSILCLLECQAEGDRLLRVEVGIEWDQPLTQCMVDGLLVAQQNPRPARGIYEQCNADSTRIFGNPEARPDAIEFDEQGVVRLIYHVLINGLVTVPFILTISDVGEQVAWNGFLALRDGRHVFETSNRRWDEILQTSRLWTPEPALNWSVQQGRIATVRHCQRLRTGLAPSDRLVDHIPALVDSFDTFDPVQSRNLLAHLRRVVEKTEGHLPLILPLSPKESTTLPGLGLSQTVAAYLGAFYNHIQRYFDVELLAEHGHAIRLCGDALVQYYSENNLHQDRDSLSTILQGLAYARQLVALLEEGDIDHWHRLYEQCHQESVTPIVVQYKDITFQPQDIWESVSLAGWALWQGCGLQGLFSLRQCLPENDSQFTSAKLEPQWPADWCWWSVMAFRQWDPAKRLGIGRDDPSTVWHFVSDEDMLYTTSPLLSIENSSPCCQIRTQNIDELEFDLQFEIILTETGEAHIFKPTFNVNFFSEPV